MKWTDAERADAYHFHALPEEWWDLDYEDFLQQRRVLLADVVRQGFDKIR